MLDCSIAIDAHGNAKIVFFDSTRGRWQNRKGCLPPEHRSKTGNSPTSGTTDSRTDIFQLGLTLWLLAEHECYQAKPIFCIRAGYRSVLGRNCPVHGNPITLPPLSSDIPPYFQKIIDICRSQNPEDKLSAARLLDLFPEEAASTTTTIVHGPDESFHLQQTSGGASS